MAMKVDEGICMGCNGACATVCMGHYITVSGKFAVINEDCCTDCGNCMKICPIGAIKGA